LIKQQINRVVKGIGVPDFHLEDIKSLQIPLPPLSIQNEIADHIQSLRNRAKELQLRADEVLDNSKIEVENMILYGVPQKGERS
jgi:type I restriction enzyme S subunit